MNNEKGKLSRKSIDERLREHPELRERVARLLDVVENSEGDVIKASEAEQLVMEELRRLGHEALQGWAIRQQNQQEEYWNEREGVSRKDKKKSGGTADSVKSK